MLSSTTDMTSVGSTGSRTASSITLGIEEEYLLVDPESRDLAAEPPPSFFAACEARLPGRVRPEFLKSQIEVATGICGSPADARRELVELRQTVAEIARAHDLALIAAATHPFARWSTQHHTARERYHHLARDLAGVGRRMVICGLHVHAGIPDDDLRIDLMNQASYFLPHLLALSTSSPFWLGEDSGLKSYRLSVFDTLPRTGLPERFESYGEYRRMVDRMVKAGLIDDATKLWWDLRPSERYPTLELRITDVCTRVDDTIAIAALYVGTLAMLRRLKEANQRWRIYALPLIRENRWLAQRYGVRGSLVDFGKGERVPFASLLDELIELVRPDAEAGGYWSEVQHAREIIRRGTSAERQLNVWQESLSQGASAENALKAVVDWLVRETQLTG